MELLIRLNVEIAKYFQEEADNKNKLHNVVENFEDISSDDKKEIENLIDKINGEHSIYNHSRKFCHHIYILCGI